MPIEEAPTTENLRQSQQSDIDEIIDTKEEGPPATNLQQKPKLPIRKNNFFSASSTSSNHSSSITLLTGQKIRDKDERPEIVAYSPRKPNARILRQAQQNHFH